MFTDEQAHLFEQCRRIAPGIEIHHEIFRSGIPGIEVLPVLCAYATPQRPLARIQANACKCGAPKCLEVAVLHLLTASLFVLRQSN